MTIESDPRRFPPPWRTEPIPAGRLVVGANGTKLAYVYGVDPRAQTSMAGSLTFGQAEAVAAAIAALPGVLRDGERAPTTGLKCAFHVVELKGGFKVVEASGYGIATIYCDDPRAGDLTWDEARRIASNVAKVLGSPP